VAPAQTHLFTAWQGRTPVAHMLFLCHGRSATYHIGHISPVGRAVCAHNLLLWHASDCLADRGFSQVDLGLLHRDSPGLTRFKRRAGAQVQMTGGTWLRWTPLAR
jgi:lipid II:glycine glycyltransferase (peptidoglycan interpeptide bridge formation enzyme)